MSWLRSHRTAALLIGLTLLLPGYFYLSVFFELIGVGFEYRNDGGRVESRLARVQGLLLKREVLSEQSDNAAAVLREQAFTDGEDPSALAASLQAEARQIFTEAGMTVTNSQVQPLRRGEVFDRLAVKIVLAGSIEALDTALVGIAAHRPKLLIELIDVFPANSSVRRSESEPQLLTAVVQLMALRVVP